MLQPTRFGSLQHYVKGGVEVIDDDPRNYVFSNLFEVAARSKPYEKVAVGKNIEYVIEAIRAEGTSAWRAPAQDEFALVMDGEVEIRLLALADAGVVLAGTRGSVELSGTPAGRKMGVVRARRGHMTLLPAGAAYQFHAARPGVILLQTVAGRDTVERWSEICQTAPQPMHRPTVRRTT
ncbi:MAG: hydroxyquinol 1,2-dioxygenase [Candidatus Rokubacteria bacterium]|nr:hydroxyquinol 1,2-dioxygenase [Candidatus Rokubacteria bacterium]